MNEINIMKSLKHPCIVSTEEVFDYHDAVYIVLEFMQGGELFDMIREQGQLTERMTKFVFRQMVLAVKYLHSQGIAHRDLKPENVLLESKENYSLVKITDFGLSKYVGEDSFMKTMCGTPLYLAPEVLRVNEQRRYGPEVDVWSLGVILFVCLVGYLPFCSEYKSLSLKEQILKGKYRYSEFHWKDVSLEAKALMKKMLTVKVEKRITLNQILNHAWMQDYDAIVRVEKLLSHKILMTDMSQLTVSSTTTNDENDNPETFTIRVLAAEKRGLSDSYSSCEPMKKKLCVGLMDPKHDDTASNNSYCSEE